MLGRSWPLGVTARPNPSQQFFCMWIPCTGRAVGHVSQNLRLLHPFLKLSGLLDLMGAVENARLSAYVPPDCTREKHTQPPLLDSWPCIKARRRGKTVAFPVVPCPALRFSGAKTEMKQKEDQLMSVHVFQKLQLEISVEQCQSLRGSVYTDSICFSDVSALWGSVSAPGACRACFLTRAPPVTFYGVH